MKTSITATERRRAKCSGPLVVFAAASLAISLSVFQSSDAASSIESTEQFGRGLRISLTYQGDKSATYARICLVEAEKLRREQREESNQSAVRKFKEAADIFRTVKDWQAIATALRSAGEISQILSESEQAFSFYREALSASRKAGDRGEEGRIRNDIGYLRFLLGDTEDAVKNCSEALRIALAMNDRSLEAQALVNLGFCSYASGDLSTATAYQQRALEILKITDDQPTHSKALVAMGYDYLNLGEPTKAKQCLREALQIAHDAVDLRAESLALIALANLESKLGEKQNAMDLYNQARELVRRIGDRSLEASVLGGLGYVSFGLSEKEKALEYDKQAITLFESTNDKWGVAEATLDVGRIYHLLGEEQQALDHSRRALGMFRTLSMPRLAAQALRDMGLVYESQHDTARAISSYTSALQQTRAGQDQRHQAYTLNDIGRVYDDLGQGQKALKYYYQALSLNRVAADPAGESLSLYQIARAERRLGHFDESRVKANDALTIIESLRVKVASQDSRAAYFASTRQYYELFVDVLMQLHAGRPADGFGIAAFDISERARARSLLELLNEARSDLRQGVDPALLEQERNLEQAINAKAERHTQLVGKKATAEAQVVAAELNQLTTAYEQVKARIKSESPRYAALTQPQPLSLKEIQNRLLDDNSVLLEYMLGDERSYLWAVTRTEVSSYELPPRAKLEDAAQSFRKLLTANQPVAGESFDQQQSRIKEAEAQISKATASFSQMVLGPVAGQLGTKRLLIVPDGALQYIPFQALTVRANGAGNSGEQIPLIVDHEIVNEPSASALALVLSDTSQRRPAPNSIAVFANPVFEVDDSRVKSGAAQAQSPDVTKTPPGQGAFFDIGYGEGRIPALPASRDEAEAIMAVVPWGTGLKALDFDANRAAITKPELAQYRIVHFATHGFINYLHPELSGLVLSLVDQNGRPQEGFVRLHDIYNLKLSADLVVLSACNTGLGKDVKGEGLIGLTRGFMYAGAGGVAASLWKVDDEATAELMKHFYEGMFQRGLTPAAALREAQLGMWKGKRWHAPYYWAAFVIQGQYDQQVMTGFQSSRIKFWAITAVAASLLFLAAFLVLRRRRKRIL
jgi:CHAT domain-containing protein/Tfp pilus assembly protein PilF